MFRKDERSLPGRTAHRTCRCESKPSPSQCYLTRPDDITCMSMPNGEKDPTPGHSVFFTRMASLCNGVTTVADAVARMAKLRGFKQRVIDRRNRCCLLNIVVGMRGPNNENNTDIWRRATAAMLRNTGLLVGIKSATFGHGWKPLSRLCRGPLRTSVMIDFGENGTERPCSRDVENSATRRHLHHCTPGCPGTGSADAGADQPCSSTQTRHLLRLGHARQFNWSLAVPMMKDGFQPDSIPRSAHYQHECR